MLLCRCEHELLDQFWAPYGESVRKNRSRSSCAYVSPIDSKMPSRLPGAALVGCVMLYSALTQSGVMATSHIASVPLAAADCRLASLMGKGLLIGGRGVTGLLGLVTPKVRFSSRFFRSVLPGAAKSLIPGVM